MGRVISLIYGLIFDLQGIAAEHDLSKLEEPEKSIFDKFTPKLKSSTYGSDEYKAHLKEMSIAIDHHYKNNRHHPEFHENGISDMNLVDLIELLCDWKAASERHVDGDIRESIRINSTRFGIEPQLVRILLNTVDYLNELEGKK